MLLPLIPSLVLFLSLCRYEFLAYIIFLHFKELFNISSKVGLLATNSFSFCLLKKIFISFSMDNFAEYRILGWKHFSFNI
jgi:hypothetical protein